MSTVAIGVAERARWVGVTSAGGNAIRPLPSEPPPRPPPVLLAVAFCPDRHQRAGEGAGLYLDVIGSALEGLACLSVRFVRGQ